MSIEWGPEILVDGVRPAWLADGDKIIVRWGSARGVESVEGAWNPQLIDKEINDRAGWDSVFAICLPATHFASIVQAYNDKHGTDFYPWAGGVSAPSDWDGGRPLALDDGETRLLRSTPMRNCWVRGGAFVDIIGYTRRTECMGNMPLTDASQPTDTRMTEGEALRLIARHNGDHIAILRELGMIRDDQTQARIAAETGVKLSDVSRVIAAYEGIKNG